MITTLYRRGFPMSSLHIFASERSAGRVLHTEFGSLTVEAFNLEAVRDTDICLMAVSGDFSKEWSPQISAEGGAVVIDNSSAWRYTDGVPLCVPEINPRSIVGKRLIANPNCTTAIAAVALYPLHVKYGLKRVIVSTYQAASGAGAEGMEELEEGIRAYASGGPIPSAKVFAHKLPFNVIPHIDVFQPNGYTKEEMKVVWETQKIFGDADIACSCTAVRVPTLRAHAEAITIETKFPISVGGAREILAASKGVTLVDDVGNKMYPMPLNASGKYDVECGRLRQSLVFGEYGLDLFVCGDQLLKGAALNAVQIAELLI
jgi:aspartate-semialdehyde dehydrogenase